MLLSHLCLMFTVTSSIFMLQARHPEIVEIFIVCGYV